MSISVNSASLFERFLQHDVWNFEVGNSLNFMYSECDISVELCKAELANRMVVSI